MTSPKTFILSIPNGVTVFSLRTLRIVGYLMDGPLEENIATFGARTCCPIMLLVGSIFAMGDLCNYITRPFKTFVVAEKTQLLSSVDHKISLTVDCQCMLELGTQCQCQLKHRVCLGISQCSQERMWYIERE